MGPIRGIRKRKKNEKKPEENASGSGSSEKEGPLDWWDDFMKRISGMFFLWYSDCFTMSACSCFLSCILDVVVLHVVVEQSHLVWVCRFLSLLIEFWILVQLISILIN